MTAPLTPDERSMDDMLRDCWRAAGGEFHGPNVETGTMPESKLLPYLQRLYQEISDLEHAKTESGFQYRVRPWLWKCFGQEVSENRVERNHRFLEEALELVQACGCSKEHALQIVDYVYGRPLGAPAQEVGGVMVTLAALCLAQSIDLDAAAEGELARVWTKIEEIRAKQAGKVKDSALPGSAPSASAPAEAREAQSPIVRAGNAFVAAHKREPKSPSDSAWMNGYYAALCAPVEPQGWQPIETAPKDRALLLWLPMGRTVMGHWDTQGHHSKPRPYWDTAENVFGVLWARENQPTHWMPLPSAPSTKGGSR